MDRRNQSSSFRERVATAVGTAIFKGGVDLFLEERLGGAIDGFPPLTTEARAVRRACAEAFRRMDGTHARVIRSSSRRRDPSASASTDPQGEGGERFLAFDDACDFARRAATTTERGLLPDTALPVLQLGHGLYVVGTSSAEEAGNLTRLVAQSDRTLVVQEYDRDHATDATRTSLQRSLVSKSRDAFRQLLASGGSDAQCLQGAVQTS